MQNSFYHTAIVLLYIAFVIIIIFLNINKSMLLGLQIYYYIIPTSRTRALLSHTSSIIIILLS